VKGSSTSYPVVKVVSALVQSTDDEAKWATVVHLFLELRERGGTLSAHDLATLCRWQEQQISPEAVAEKMRQLYTNCLARQKAFPASLKGLETRLKRMAANGYA
jgi:hypothetical protein